MIPLRFTRGLEFGLQTQDSRDGELLEEDVEEAAVGLICRPFFD